MTAVAVLGAGEAGRTFAYRAVEVGHRVTVGDRSASSEALDAFTGLPGVVTGTFSEAAAAARLLVNATAPADTREVLELAGAENLAGKTLLDISTGLGSTKSGARRRLRRTTPSWSIEAAHPRLNVVRVFNTMSPLVLANPMLVPDDHALFLCGVEAASKAEVRSLLGSFGWHSAQLVDVGEVDPAAATKTMMAIWMRICVTRAMNGPIFSRGAS